METPLANRRRRGSLSRGTRTRLRALNEPGLWHALAARSLYND